MKVPVNFSNVDRMKFDIGKYRFYCEPDGNIDGYLWVFPDGDYEDIPNCLWFQMDWNLNKYTVTKCKLGEGNTGKDIIYDEPIKKQNVITKTTFVNNFLKETVEWLMNNKLY